MLSSNGQERTSTRNKLMKIEFPFWKLQHIYTHNCGDNDNDTNSNIASQLYTMVMLVLITEISISLILIISNNS